MSQSRKIADAVKAHEALGNPPGPVNIPMEDGGGTVSLAVVETGPVGLAFDELSYQSADHSDRSPEQLHQWAERLTGRVTYLMEPLVVVEHDREGSEVEVRSKAPTARRGVRSYYEVRLKGDGTLRLGRVAYDEAERRRDPVACPMTFETLDRLVDDLVDTAV